MKASFLFVFCLLSLAMTMTSQETFVNEFSCGIHKIIPPLSIERVTVNEAITVKDIHSQYEPNWIKEFISVEIQTIEDGQTKVAIGVDDKLTSEQIENLNASDLDSDIYLRIDYLPNNNLKHNDPKSYDATFRINPDKDAEFAAGDKAMKTYLLDNVISKINDYKFEQYALAAVKFTIDESGRIENVIIKESIKDKLVDQRLIDAICNMPTWKAAEFYEGTKVDQDFVLTVGDMQSCIVPTLNIKRY